MKNIENKLEELKKQLEVCEQLCDGSCECTNHPKYGDFKEAVKEQNYLIAALESMINLSEMLSQKKDRESNDYRIKTLLSNVINKSTKLSSLITIITKKKTDRKENCKSYYKSHKREIQIRHRGYPKNRTDWRIRNKEHCLEYNYKRQERDSVLNKMRRFCFCDASNGRKDFFNELKRCINSPTLLQT